MIHFSRLRLSGFKSFVDPTEVVIEPGLTGVVGPNGCGKSNLVEALRWVMGENSARQMRGGEMDDVIFGGTSNRPPRNLAEVSLLLDNSERSAPAQFNDAAELEISRRIARGEGSLYRVNGREVRARDVQILFADAASGARSTAIVSQGRIGALINAKPSDRRSLLEEAAGIGGLHGRRQEAEMRLKAAEGNLERLQDVLSAQTQSLQSLRRQARQAARYRALSEEIRGTEARLLAAFWRIAGAALEEARQGLKNAEERVRTATGLAAEATLRQAEAAEAMPALRQAEIEAAAGLQRLGLQKQKIDEEESRLAQSRQDMLQRLAQIEGDLKREAERAADAAATRARLDAEKAELLSASEGDGARREQAESAVAAAQAALEEVEAALNRVLEEVAAADAGRAAAIRALNEAEQRRERLAQRSAEMAEAQKSAAAQAVEREALTAAEMDLEEAQEYLDICRQRIESGEIGRARAEEARARAQETLHRLAAEHSRLAAEADAIRSVLAQAGGGAAPILDEITAPDGTETALGAAIGEDLSAPLDKEAPLSWRTLPPPETSPALPAGARPLAQLITAPTALSRRLSQIGLLDDPARGPALQAGLAPGQCLVTADGAFWRWDGFTGKAGAPSPAAARLHQKNRLKVLAAGLEDAKLGLAEAEAASIRAAEAVAAELAAARQAREDARKAEIEAAGLRDAHDRLARRAAETEARLAGLAEQAAALAADLGAAVAEEERLRARLSEFSGNEAGREKLAALKAALAERRAGLVEAQSLLDRLRREAGDRQRRLEALARDGASWDHRLAAAARHRQELEGRKAEALRELEGLDAAPADIAEKRGRLAGLIEEAETLRRQAADRLAAGETALAAADRAQKEAEALLAASREERIRREAAEEAARHHRQGIAERIAERLDLSPADLPPWSAEDPHAMPDAAETARIEKRLASLLADREALGPVNLRAEAEAEEMERQRAELAAEREDLLGAIAKFRHAIAELNREGRDRLLASFEEVDRHFRQMFVRLFGGGRAHLSLTESSDPLQAGLEIMASPPGKRLQMMSLLSGGEQALTALALLFAVFMTNPAPICILDEVDAPLDDANVDRFCTLVEEIAHASKTRFLVVTHHRMTMARMDRLFGVTMGERGVSTLVAVDLKTAERMREPA